MDKGYDIELTKETITKKALEGAGYLITWFQISNLT